MRPVSKHPKEAKASRKKRNRGVSGSSIKKDGGCTFALSSKLSYQRCFPSGGRFDMGLDYEDFVEDDIEERTEDVEAEDYNEYCRQNWLVVLLKYRWILRRTSLS